MQAAARLLTTTMRRMHDEAIRRATAQHFGHRYLHAQFLSAAYLRNQATSLSRVKRLLRTPLPNASQTTTSMPAGSSQADNLQPVSSQADAAMLSQGCEFGMDESVLELPAEPVPTIAARRHTASGSTLSASIGPSHAESDVDLSDEEETDSAKRAKRLGQETRSRKNHVK